jgi:hypothetical protein
VLGRSILVAFDELSEYSDVDLKQSQSILRCYGGCEQELVPLSMWFQASNCSLYSSEDPARFWTRLQSNRNRKQANPECRANDLPFPNNADATATCRVGGCLFNHCFPDQLVQRPRRDCDTSYKARLQCSSIGVPVVSAHLKQGQSSPTFHKHNVPRTEVGVTCQELNARLPDGDDGRGCTTTWR